MRLPIPHVNLDRLAQECRVILKHVAPGVAVFDADGTLWAPDIANRLWRRILFERSIVSPGREVMFEALHQAGLDSKGDPHEDAMVILNAYFAGRVEEEIIVRVMINALAGLSRVRVDEIVHRALHADQPSFALEAHLGMADFVRDLHRQGMRIVICSGSPVWAVEAGARALNLPIETVLAGDVTQPGGHLSPEIVEPLTFREGKGRAYDQLIGTAPLFAFGDGESDIPLLDRARFLSVAVNPRPSLIRELPRFGTRARILHFDRTEGGRPIVPPAQDESID